MSSYVILGIAGLFLFLILVLMNYVMVSKLYSDNPAKKMVSEDSPESMAQKTMEDLPEEQFKVSVDLSNTDKAVPNINRAVPDIPDVQSEKAVTSDQQYRQTLKTISLKDNSPEELINLPKADIEYRQALRSLGNLKQKRP